ncbi:MAG: carboxymuconolactone decarboxylase family protein [Desulfarculus sp.]|jgi:alkylhydroperoxidase/carboxymuconolactone decarboxylase family protein YurZ|nr:MAG: carboxymuconolactone decarboxylase family protein [Desulfarculus sp.]
MNVSLPKPYTDFKKQYPELAQDFEALGVKCRQVGPLDERAAHMVKLGLAIATGSKGGIKSQARRAMDDGFTLEEVRHAAILALPTIGFPPIIAALGWINEVAAE